MESGCHAKTRSALAKTTSDVGQVEYGGKGLTGHRTEPPNLAKRLVLGQSDAFATPNLERDFHTRNSQ
jgi:hypothetical protein